MPARTEVLGDGTIGGEESLGITRGFEPLHAPLALTSGLMRVLSTMIEIPVLTMFHPWENLALGGSIALQFVGDDHAWYIGQAFQKFAEELLRGPLISAALDQDIQHVPVLIDRPSENLTLTFDRQQHLVHVPLIAWARAAATQLVGIRLANLVTPFTNGFIAHDHTAFK
jgi:hypothetical protein